MFQDITLQELFAKGRDGQTIIDVRSPKEFHESSIPGSINIPVFDDAERAEVGTLYKQVGQNKAKERGLEIFSTKLPAFIKAFQQIETPKTVYCWRGGMRSKTTATVLDLMGIHVSRLTGGIRTYRQWVVRELEKGEFSPDLLVLNGNTGNGKTVILRELLKQGYPVLDLEGLASHRGSIFGQIGLETGNQKQFESGLVQAMHQYHNAPFVLTEGESKRIGRATMPDFLYEKKEESTQIFISLPVDKRVENILDDYQPWNNPAQFMEAFNIIKKRIHTPIAKQIDEDLQHGNFHEVVKLLLEYYYDPRYEHAAKQYPDNAKIFITAKDNADALNQVIQVTKKRYQHVSI